MICQKGTFLAGSYTIDAQGVTLSVGFVGWFVFCWLVGWLVGWLIGWLIGWLVGWLVD